MLNGKYTSIKEIIDSVYRDTGFKDELPWEDLIYWAYEALDLIGMPEQYIAKVTGSADNPNLKATNYRAKLPCDFHQLRQIAVNGHAARYAGYTFHHLLDGDCCNVSELQKTAEDIYIDNFGNSFSNVCTNCVSGNCGSGITYDINNEYITLSTKEGDICISYWAFPVDNDGYPLIPEDIKYKNAVKSYLMMKIFYRMWIADDTKRAKFEHAEREWMWYVGAAQNRATMPNPDKMEMIKNQIMRLVPKVNQHNDFFRSTGSQERRRQH